MDFPGHFQHIFQQLNHQRLHAQLCDCVVVVGGQSFQAHRSILAACSSHFRALLSSSDSGHEVGGAAADRGGSGEPSVMELDPEVVTPEAFSTLLDMIYTSTLSLGASNVMDVLLAASHLHLNNVVKACKLYLSRQNFPASPPKGWRSVQQEQQQRPSSQAANVAAVSLQQQRSVSLQHLEFSLVTSAMEEDLDEGRVHLEVSQSGEVEADGVRKRINDEQGLAMRHKRKSHEDRVSGTKRACRLPGERENSPTVTGSTVNREEAREELSSPDCPKTADGHWGSRTEEEVEVKYEASKGESEEVQLPSQSDSSTGEVGMWEKDGDTDGKAVVKVKVGEESMEEGEEPKMEVIEVKKENLSSYSPDLNTVPNNSPPSPLEDSTDHLDMHVHDGKIAIAILTENIDHQIDAQREVGDVGEESAEGLDSLSELAFSCFLNPNGESDMGGLEVEDSLASLTAAATAAAAASDAPASAGDTGEPCQNSEEATTSSSHPSDSPSSLVFPVTSVPLQQLLPTQGPAFSDTLILQPAQTSLAGFLSGINPASIVQPSKNGKSRGCGGSGSTTFRRIAPKVVPGSETSADPDASSSGSAGDAVDRPPLTRASEDVLSKCKKAAAEDHVLLVEGDKKYACKMCCKTFMNLTDCKKHIRVHTGEKPYPCPKCGKRFSQSSHLYKHSKNTCISWKGDQSLPDTLL
ncbi:hypothetical protein LDENG_00036880 [Lucifuga dentata]|nr:hypothetical protein LDENG_00036880 [Lucifuga dentata]